MHFGAGTHILRSTCLKFIQTEIFSFCRWSSCPIFTLLRLWQKIWKKIKCWTHQRLWNIIQSFLHKCTFILSSVYSKPRRYNDSRTGQWHQQVFLNKTRVFYRLDRFAIQRRCGKLGQLGPKYNGPNILTHFQHLPVLLLAPTITSYPRVWQKRLWQFFYFDLCSHTTPMQSFLPTDHYWTWGSETRRLAREKLKINLESAMLKILRLIFWLHAQSKARHWTRPTFFKLISTFIPSTTFQTLLSFLSPKKM